MIKGRIKVNPGQNDRLLLGLSRLNCERLLNDQPIMITKEHLAALGLPTEVEIVLVAGESEGAILEQFTTAGVPIKEAP